MEDHNCDYHDQWTTEVWLLLTLICNASGAILAFTRAENFPLSWFITVLYIIVYRLIFISGRVPIIIDLAFSLLIQYVSSFGDLGWKLACTIPILTLAVIFISVYLNPLIEKYKALKEVQPDSIPLVNLLHPLSPVSFLLASWLTFFLNGFFLYVIWFYPSLDDLYCFIQEGIGIFLVFESMIFLSCYKQYLKAIPAAGRASIQGSGGTPGSARRRAKRDGKKL